jgi:hypothetical protein
MAFIVGVIFILNSDNGNQEYAFSRNDVEDNKILRSSSATPVYLYFADRNKPFLKTEERVLNNPENPILFGKVIVDALIKGPQNGLMRTVPVGTVLRALYITKDKAQCIYNNLQRISKPVCKFIRPRICIKYENI